MKFRTIIHALLCCAALCPTLTLVTVHGTPVEVSAGAGAEPPKQPQVAIDKTGRFFVVFGQGEEISLVVSSDGGRHFQSPLTIGRLPKLALGMRRGPRIAASGDSLVVTAVNNEDIFAFHSEDAGHTWSPPVQINTVAASAREGLGNLAAAPDGQVYATWLDLRSGSTQIYGALSRDGGKTWGTDELVYRSPDGHVCECCHPSAAFNSRGDLAVMWRNSLKGSRDLWTATRSANSDRFEPPIKMGAGTWKLDGCPMDGGAIFVQDDGSFASIWRRDQSVYLSLKPTQEQRLGPGTQPLGIVVKGVTHLWWQQGTDLMHATAGNQVSPEVFASNAKFAAVASSPKDGALIVVFERTIKEQKSIAAEVLR